MTPLAIPPLPVPSAVAPVPAVMPHQPVVSSEVPCFVEDSVLQSMIALGRAPAAAAQWANREPFGAHQEWCLPR
jgi:hypothetical protein